MTRRPSYPSHAGIVRLVGAGPGGVDLLTLRAVRYLAQAHVVLHDALVDPEILSLAPQARKIAVGKRAGGHVTDQQLICRLMVREAQRGLQIVRLKGGDPMLFGRAGEELDALAAAGISVEIVPGVTSASAAAADIAAPLTQRGVARSVAFVTPAVGEGEAEDDGWVRVAAAADSVAIYMASRRVRAVAQALLAGGRESTTPILLVIDAGASGARSFRADLGAAALGVLDGRADERPGILLIGRTFAGAGEQAVFEPLTPVLGAAR